VSQWCLVVSIEKELKRESGVSGAKKKREDTSLVLAFQGGKKREDGPANHRGLNEIVITSW